ncbi:2,4-dienoyl-CoA reductase-like NADH-dependent reductase (Old Yellow Enzyme family) [Cytobacillus oceanisediminis]|uniref:2,4-dienoyl-CoA reductase-like NADH-dependent reductase (Old Yellow Enzyme family) n=1 Tax=Cytobacillus oceanisediminis TaxID=665099 RepID=A0A2V3A645_9BACI|nr:FAD-dependent oxidoreductase [Cytobacillus oceanisediminis]PWW32246.1 2,4-dienoyl-CoA reductase-like NADH-dependent reductase (Old Yellow Enzyme family) [Cytobacillus oceanisediminis]
MSQFKHLFSPVSIGNTELSNRILSTAHQTNHVIDGIPTPDMTAYHVERARGGAGLLILEAAAVHPSGMLTTNTIAGYDEKVIPAYLELANEVHPYGTKVFQQLFHGGREVVSSEYKGAAWAPSAVPSLRFGTMPRPMSVEEIKEVIEGFALSAKLAKAGGLDGVEICCSHGYLPAQFWSEHTNLRTDEYGGSFQNRMRFIVEVMERVWEEAGEDFTVGIRMSADEMTMDGTDVKDAVKIVEYLVDRVRVDFIDVTAGDSSTYAGSTHIVPPSPMKHAYLTPQAFKIRMAGAVPVFVGSRIVDPVEAEQIVAAGKADVVGMTRSLIVDPEMPNKAKSGNHQKIDACIGCLQACIGHYHKGLVIGCVQNPSTGKEREVEALKKAPREKKKVLVIGAGPAGLKAALTLDEFGHEVILADKAEEIGGLLRTLRRAPMRHELAESMLDNFTRKLAISTVKVNLGCSIQPTDILKINPDVIFSAVGSRPFIPTIPGIRDPRILTADDWFYNRSKTIGKHVLVFDFTGDWPAIEAAIDLAEKGHQVTMISSKLHIGEEVHQYLRNEYLKKLYQLKVNMIPHHDLGEIKDDEAVIRNLFSYEKESIKDWDSIVLSLGRVPNVELYEQIKDLAPEVYQIGDCLAPRTLEEATYEGMMISLKLGIQNSPLQKDGNTSIAK